MAMGNGSHWTAHMGEAPPTHQNPAIITAQMSELSHRQPPPLPSKRTRVATPAEPGYPPSPRARHGGSPGHLLPVPEPSRPAWGAPPCLPLPSEQQARRQAYTRIRSGSRRVWQLHTQGHVNWEPEHPLP
jgi:hypothetical protein